MRLSAFILTNMEAILQEWEDFARSLGPVTSTMDAAALRDHAELMLGVIAADLEKPQSRAQQEAKATGHAPTRPAYLPQSAATSHGALRAEEGFSLEEMVSEYRALRASVLRLWAREEAANGHPTPTSEAYQQQLRFNEAVDEALADSIRIYSYAVDQLFGAKARRRMEALGTLAAGLGHDMTNVLLPMRFSLETLSNEGFTPANAPLVEAMRRAVAHLGGLSKGLRALVLDPEGSARTSDATVLHEWWANAISPFTWALPEGVRLHVEGLKSSDTPIPPVSIPGHALMQAVFNLVQNAAQALGQRHAANPRSSTAPEIEPTGNIWITAALVPAMPSTGAADEVAGQVVGQAVRLTVRDDGPGMDPSTLRRCTEAFFTTKPKHLGSGLGLHLVRTVVERHGGQLTVESNLGEGTVFTLILPAAEIPLTVTVVPIAATARSR